MDLGQKFLTELNYEQAVAAFKIALEIEPDNAEAVAGIISTYSAWSDDLAAQSEYEAAVARLDEARALLPDSQELIDKEVEIYILWAETYKATDLDKAIWILTEGYQKLGDSRLMEQIECYESIRMVTTPITVKASLFNSNSIGQAIWDEFIESADFSSANYSAGWNANAIRFAEPVTFWVMRDNVITDEQVTLTEAMIIASDYVDTLFDDYVPVDSSEREMKMLPYVAIASGYDGNTVSFVKETNEDDGRINRNYSVFPVGPYFVFLEDPNEE